MTGDIRAAVEALRSVDYTAMSKADIANLLAALQVRTAEAIRAEAAQYPGEDGKNCDQVELDCMDGHLHEFVTTGGEIRIVAGTPERHAELALAVFGDWLRSEAAEYEAMPASGKLRRVEVERALEASGLLFYLADQTSPRETDHGR